MCSNNSCLRIAHAIRRTNSGVETCSSWAMIYAENPDEGRDSRLNRVCINLGRARTPISSRRQAVVGSCALAAGIAFVILVTRLRIGPCAATCWRDMRAIVSGILPAKVL